MDNIALVKEFEPFEYIKGNFPDKILLKPLTLSRLLLNQASKITPISKLHNNREYIAALLKKRSFILDNIRRINGGKETDFIQSIIFLLRSQ